jgi:hypothetical protein
MKNKEAKHGFIDIGIGGRKCSCCFVKSKRERKKIFRTARRRIKREIERRIRNDFESLVELSG